MTFMAFSTNLTALGFSPLPYISESGTEIATRTIQLMLLGIGSPTTWNREVSAPDPSAYCPKVYTIEAIKQATSPVAKLPKNFPWNLSCASMTFISEPVTNRVASASIKMPNANE